MTFDEKVLTRPAASATSGADVRSIFTQLKGSELTVRFKPDPEVWPQ